MSVYTHTVYVCVCVCVCVRHRAVFLQWHGFLFCFYRHCFAFTLPYQSRVILVVNHFDALCLLTSYSHLSFSTIDDWSHCYLSRMRRYYPTLHFLCCTLSTCTVFKYCTVCQDLEDQQAVTDTSAVRRVQVVRTRRLRRVTCTTRDVIRRSVLLEAA